MLDALISEYSSGNILFVGPEVIKTRFSTVQHFIVLRPCKQTRENDWLYRSHLRNPLWTQKLCSLQLYRLF